MKDFIGAFILVLACIGIIVFTMGIEGHSGEARVKTRLENSEAFITNGYAFKVEDVEDYRYEGNLYENDTIIFTMKNGDEIHALWDNIIWKEKN